MYAYALTYNNEGVDDHTPYACTIAVSEDIEKLREEMIKWVEEDCTEPTDEDDDWDIDCNYQVFKKCGDDVMLQHKKYINLYATYKIRKVKIL